MKKSRFWTLIFSIIPGVGHFYLGLMGRGLQFSLLGAGLIIVAVITRMGVLAAFAPILWFYALFDAQHLAGRMNQGEMVPDELLLPWERLRVHSSLAGWLFIAFGLLVFFNTNFNFRSIPFLSFLHHLNLPILLLSIFLVVFGVRLIWINRGKAKEEDNL